MTNEVKLLPCPFCGASAERIDFGPGDAENEGGSCIACTQCQSSGPVEFGRKENFVSNWNRRACVEANTEALWAEVERLTGCLATANANHETFERRWYLEQDRAERLAEALRPHIEDLDRSAAVLDQYPAMAPTAAEMRKAAAELLAALNPTAAQEGDHG